MKDHIILLNSQNYPCYLLRLENGDETRFLTRNFHQWTVDSPGLTDYSCLSLGSDTMLMDKRHERHDEICVYHKAELFIYIYILNYDKYKD